MSSEVAGGSRWMLLIRLVVGVLAVQVGVAREAMLGSNGRR
jgi:hypothetical protein